MYILIFIEGKKVGRAFSTGHSGVLSNIREAFFMLGASKYIMPLGYT